MIIPASVSRRLSGRYSILNLLSGALLFLSNTSSLGGGVVLGWGDNSATQIQTPTTLANTAVGLAAGGSHSLALKTDSTVVAWGFSLLGQTLVPTNLTGVKAISGGYAHSVALKDDGTVVVWGEHPLAPEGLSNVLAVSAGRTHSLALLEDHTVISWGGMSYVPEGLDNVAAVAAGSSFSLALRFDGIVVAWGDPEAKALSVPAGLSNVVAIAAGWDHGLAIKRDGTVVAWGENGSGQCSVPAGLTGIVCISGGATHSLAMKSDGTLSSWGGTALGQTPAPPITNIARISAGGYHNLALRTDGTPLIQVSPFPVTAVVTRPAVLHVVASGNAPLRYQWQKNGANIAGATLSTLSFTSVQPADGASYRAIVTNSLGSVMSASAILTPVGASPVIVVSPKDTAVICGDATSMTSTASGSTPLSYQWLFEGQPIAGATRTRISLTNASPAFAGIYQMAVTNAYGSVTSSPAILAVNVEPPTITNSLTTAGKQGLPFTFSIRGLHTPISFSASGLPPGLSVNPTNGQISGIPLESGTFGPTIGAGNWCTWDYQTLVMVFTSSVPVITSVGQAPGEESQAFIYDITATESPTSFDASELPWGLHLSHDTGRISGVPVYAGEYDTTISASNAWGMAYAPLHLSISNAAVGGLSIDNVTFAYSSPYLLDFQFSLRDSDDPAEGSAVVADPRLLSVTCRENGTPVSPLETAVILARGSTKLFKSFMVLDYTESIASLANGDTNHNNISDVVEDMVSSAQEFINQQRAGSQVGVYEFHREDEDPVMVQGLTADKALLNTAIAGIWTNYVEGFSGSSRAWDAVVGAISALGTNNNDEEHFIVLVSDGRDESSTNTIEAVMTAATNNSVKIYSIGFGAELDETTLQDLSRETKGRYYNAMTLQGITEAFDQIERDFAGQYVLRWATLKRTSKAFTPSFDIAFQGHLALSPTNPIITSTNIVPPATNPPPPVTNIVIATYIPTQHTGTVTAGTLRLVGDASGRADSLILRATYVPRHVKQILIKYRPNWPEVPELMSTESGEILNGWSLSETNDSTGQRWMMLSTDPASNAIPFAAFGNLVRFNFRDITSSTNAFSSFTNENSIYPAATKLSFMLDSTNLAGFTQLYPVLPFGTPGPWLSAHGFTGDLSVAELSDPDLDGVPTWQEYQANTDPQDPVSRFAVGQITFLTDGRRRLAFTTSLARHYRVETSADLVTWEVIGDKIPGTGAPITFTDGRYLPGLTQIYYRVMAY